MKTKFFFLAFLVVLFSACTAQRPQPSIERAIGEKLYARFSGTCFVKSTQSNACLLLVNTTQSTDSYDKALVLFSESNIKPPSIKENTIYEFYIPENRRYLVAHQPGSGELFVWGLTDTAARQFITRFRSRLDGGSQFRNELQGYGLSYLSGVWSKGRIAESSYRQPFNTLDYADKAQPDAARDLPAPGSAEEGVDLCAKGQCTSGGAGSVSCSQGEVLNLNCSVTCASGYYACCNSTSVRCYCCKIQ